MSKNKHFDLQKFMSRRKIINWNVAFHRSCLIINYIIIVSDLLNYIIVVVSDLLNYIIVVLDVLNYIIVVSDGQGQNHNRNDCRHTDGWYCPGTTMQCQTIQSTIKLDYCQVFWLKSCFLDRIFLSQAKYPDCRKYPNCRRARTPLTNSLSSRPTSKTTILLIFRWPIVLLFRRPFFYHSDGQLFYIWNK